MYPVTQGVRDSDKRRALYWESYRESSSCQQHITPKHGLELQCIKSVYVRINKHTRNKYALLYGLILGLPYSMVQSPS